MVFLPKFPRTGTSCNIKSMIIIGALKSGHRKRGQNILGRTRKQILGGKRPQGGKGGEGSQQGKRGKDVRKEKGKDLGGGEGLGGEGLNSERWQKILGRKREKISGGGKALGGKGGKGSQQKKGGKNPRKKRDKIWGEKASGGKGEK